jgi:hypothetical protein
VSNDSDALIRGLRAMDAPEPRPGFVDRALANATGVSASRHASDQASSKRYDWRHVAMSWETWLGAVMGGAVAAALTVVLMRPAAPHPGEQAITLALNEVRNIDVLIDSDRELQDATIRIAVTGGVALDGLANDHIVDWHADLGRGPNLLSLPVIARKAGDGQLVAIVEHDGKTRTVMINLTVSDPGASRS